MHNLTLSASLGRSIERPSDADSDYR